MTITPAIAIEQLKTIQLNDGGEYGDTETQHMSADAVLCDLLTALGHGDVVAEWEKISRSGMPEAPDFTVFLKLMNLTTSSFDHEALSAIRMANSVLDLMNQTWEDLLAGKIVMIAPRNDVAVSAPKPGEVRYTNFTEIDSYFTALSNRNLGTFADWVKSVYEFWKDKGYLTQRQYDVLKKAALRPRK